MLRAIVTTRMTALKYRISFPLIVFTDQILPCSPRNIKQCGTSAGVLIINKDEGQYGCCFSYHNRPCFFTSMTGLYAPGREFSMISLYPQKKRRQAFACLRHTDIPLIFSGQISQAFSSQHRRCAHNTSGSRCGHHCLHRCCAATASFPEQRWSGSSVCLHRGRYPEHCSDP